MTDLTSFNPLIDYLDQDKDIVYEDNFVCPQIYQRLVINSDGMALMCCNDRENEQIVGDINKESVHQVWRGSKLQNIRETINKQNGFKSFYMCKRCYYPRKAIPDEKAQVGDRVIWIENYINRLYDQLSTM